MPAERPGTVLPLSEEKIHVGKRLRESGRVRVSVRTETVEEVVRETLRSRSAEVTRVPVGQEVDQLPVTREEDGVVIIPVVEEVLVVVKKLFLKEEIHLRFHENEENVEQVVERRVQNSVVERLISDGPDSSAHQDSPESTPHSEE
ncbi:DUF2382 domain-containing protein [Roseomonas marmotae]|uniref:DUF2382 domain-containing protein n=1 Tax=Roseomonas marmotae TaxID=2768161 RepID=A0ABS3KDM8_9PROT|nr:DUF2382 domain-containing protein [Roseomonas marmotae]MBO1075584.1 DUF2382 domain-containing protein [Roseomonas marmotae]QTI79446.1 DUF2382 domain-containing protein [Roseomonas marmotae]